MKIHSQVLRAFLRCHLAVSLCALGAAGCTQTFLPARQTPAWEPWLRQAAASGAAPEDNGNFSDALLKGYQRNLRRPGRPDGPGCAFSPTCSVYARQCYSRHGFWAGTALTVGRVVFRERSVAGGSYLPVLDEDRWQLYDPAP